MNKSSYLFDVMLFCTLGLFLSAADTQASCYDPYGGPCKSERSGGGGSGGGGNAAAIIGLGLGLIIQGMENVPADEPERRTEPRKPNAFDDMARERKAAAEREKKLKRLQGQAAANSSLDPWAGKPTAKNNAKSDGRAPYADKSCADIKADGAGISQGYTKVINKCAFPIQVIHCYYDKGKAEQCESFKSGWGTTSTISQKSSTSSFSPKRPGFGVRYFVCNMAGVKNHSKLCLLPKA